MFEWILFGLIAAVTVAACVTIDTLRKAMTKAKINLSEIIDIDRVRNRVTLQDLESRLKITVTGDDISNEIYRGRKIRVAIAPQNEEHDSWLGLSPEDEAICDELLKRLETDPDALGCALACEEQMPPFVKG